MSRIGITGSPKTGKSTVSSLLAKKLGAEHVDLNSLLIKHGGAERVEEGEYELLLPRARRIVKNTLEKIEGRSYIVSSLFLADLLNPKLVDFVFVLRCNPKVLYERYRQSGYPQSKAKENVVAEAIGVISSECLKKFRRKVFEIDTTNKEPEEVVEEIAAYLDGKLKARFHVDWLSEAERDKELLDLLL